MPENKLGTHGAITEDSKPLCARSIELAETVDTRALLKAAQASGLRDIYYWRSPEGEILIGLGSAVSWSLPESASDWRSVFREFSNRFSCLCSEISPAAPLKALFTIFFDPREQSEEWRLFDPLRLTLPELLYREHEGKAELQIVVGTGGADTLVQAFNDLLSASATCEGRAVKEKPTAEEQAAEEQVAGLEIDWHDEEYRETVRRGLDLLQFSPLQKIVLGRRAEISDGTDIDVTALAENLRRSYPDCFSFSWSPDGTSHFVSATPERLARIQGRDFVSAALAGTITVGESGEESKDVLEQLRRSKKDMEEHAYVADMILDVAGSFCSDIAAGSPEILSLRNVHHLLTPIHGRLNPGIGMADVVASMHPTPAVGGTPVQLAIDSIHRLEPFTRGLFAGTVGWLDAEGNGDAAVAIRSSLLRGKTALAFAGAGIISGSDIERETAETRSKLAAVVNALQ